MIGGRDAKQLASVAARLGGIAVLGTPKRVACLGCGDPTTVEHAPEGDYYRCGNCEYERFTPRATLRRVYGVKSAEQLRQMVAKATRETDDQAVRRALKDGRIA